MSGQSRAVTIFITLLWPNNSLNCCDRNSSSLEGDCWLWCCVCVCVCVCVCGMTMNM